MRENLRFQARLHGLDATAAERIAELLDAVGMERRADELVRNLSAGMAQRVAVCRAVLHEPELLLLDEPRSHLDPEAAALVEPLIGPARAAPGCSSATTSSRARRGRPRAGARAGGAVAYEGRPARAATLGRSTGARRDVRSRARDAFAAILAKDLRVELRTLHSLPAMALFAITTFVIFRFGLDRTSARGQPRRRGAAGDAPVRRDPGDQPPLRRRARGGRLRRDPPGAGRPHRALRRQGVGAVRLPGGARAGRRAGLRALLPRLCGRAAAARAGVLLLADLGLAATGPLISSIATNSRARDLLAPLILLPLLVPLMIAAAGAAEPLLAAGGPDTTASAPGWRCSAFTIWSSSLVGYAVYDFLLED